MAGETSSAEHPHSDKNKSHDCKDNCGHNACQCSCVNLIPLQSSMGAGEYLLPKTINPDRFPDFVLSSGFHTIWIPPKIG